MRMNANKHVLNKLPQRCWYSIKNSAKQWLVRMCQKIIYDPERLPKIFLYLPPVSSQPRCILQLLIIVMLC